MRPSGIPCWCVTCSSRPCSCGKRSWRTNLTVLFFVSLAVNVGMYIERVVIVPITLSRNELPASWGVYTLQLPETLITIGAFAFVFFAYITFTRFFPIIPVWEVYEGQLLHAVRKVGKALTHLKSAD